MLIKIVRIVKINRSVKFWLILDYHRILIKIGIAVPVIRVEESMPQIYKKMAIMNMKILSHDKIYFLRFKISVLNHMKPSKKCSDLI